ncbi:hypothetical protein M3Y97_00441500 [Aphelenchoides bicaudatus]|nr:hypothetical protein M3Y97_00441500 [Aphelenchoides bicaudatus]
MQIFLKAYFCTQVIDVVTRLTVNKNAQAVFRLYSTASPLTLERLDGEEKGIAVIHLHKPDTKNAISKLMLSKLRHSVEEIKFDKSARVLILKSDVPGAFCTGADLKERKSMPIEEVPKFVDGIRQLTNDLSSLQVPVIAAIDGFALGGGLELALACDIRVASSKSRFGLTETKLGIIPGAGGTQRLSRLIGPALAKELIFTARVLSGDESKAIGLVNHVSEGDPYLKAREIAKDILKTGPISIRVAKIAIDRGSEVDLSSGLSIEQQCYAQVINTKDRLEGLQAFAEKRPPEQVFQLNVLLCRLSLLFKLAVTFLIQILTETRKLQALFNILANCMRRFCDQMLIPNSVYELGAVMIHEGANVSCGHYYDIIKDAKTDKWFSYNDKDVTEIKAPGVASEKPKIARATADLKGCYVLIYRKSEASPDTSSSQEVSNGSKELRMPPDEVVQEIERKLNESFRDKTQGESMLYNVWNNCINERFDLLDHFWSLLSLDSLKTITDLPSTVAFLPTELLIDIQDKEFKADQPPEKRIRLEENGDQSPTEMSSEQSPEISVLANGNASISLSPDIEMVGEKVQQIIINEDLICPHGGLDGKAKKIWLHAHEWEKLVVDLFGTYKTLPMLRLPIVLSRFTTVRIVPFASIRQIQTPTPGEQIDNVTEKKRQIPLDEKLEFEERYRRRMEEMESARSKTKHLGLMGCFFACLFGLQAYCLWTRQSENKKMNKVLPPIKFEQFKQDYLLKGNVAKLVLHSNFRVIDVFLGDLTPEQETKKAIKTFFSTLSTGPERFKPVPDVRVSFEGTVEDLEKAVFEIQSSMKESSCVHIENYAYPSYRETALIGGGTIAPQNATFSRVFMHSGPAPGVPVKGLNTKPPSRRQIIKYLLENVWPKDNPTIRKRVIIALGVLAAAKTVNACVPFLLRDVVDAYAKIKPETPEVFLAIGVSGIVAYGVFRAANSALNELRNAVFAKVDQHSLTKTGRKIFEHLHNLSLSFHVNRQTGAMYRAIDRGVRGMSFVQRSLVFNIVPTLLEFSFVSGILYVKCGPIFAVITMSTFVTYAAATIGITMWRTKFRHQMNEADNNANNKAVDSLVNYETVKLNTNEKFEAVRYAESLKLYEDASLKTAYSLSLLNSVQGVIFSAGMIASMYLAAINITNGTMTVGDMVMINALLIQLGVPLNFLGSVYREIRQGFQDMQAMFSLLNLKSDIIEKPNAQTLVVTPQNAAIKFDNVVFGYDPTQEPLINGLSLEVPTGKKVAIVGGTGTGKSTIFRLLCRLYDSNSGAITVNDQNVRNVTLNSLRRSIAIVPQDIFALGIWLYIDTAAVYKADWNNVYILVTIASCVAMFMVNSVSNSQIHGGSYDYEGILGTRGARFWLMLAFILSFASLVAATWLMFSEYVLREGNDPKWPGVALFLNNFLIFAASLAIMKLTTNRWHLLINFGCIYQLAH